MAISLRELFKLRLQNLLAWGIIAVLLACVVAAPAIAPYNPYAVNMSQQFLPPSPSHLFGTDDVGRDIFSRVVFGARYSLAMGLVVTLVSTLMGILLGITAAYAGGKVDEMIMRVCDLFLGFPALLLAMAIAAVLGSSLTNAIVAASAVWWPSYVRLMRSQALAVKSEPFVDAARAMGARPTTIIFRHLLPNSWAPLIVRVTMDLGRAVLFTGALSFIGLGAQPPLPEWGAMLAGARVHLLGAWWYPTFPGLAISFAVFGFSLLGDIFGDMYQGEH